MADYVKVHAQAVSNALGQWDTAAENAVSEFNAKAQAALAAFKNADWAGNDDAGKEFKKAIDVKQVTEGLDGPKYLTAQGGAKVPLNGAAAVAECVDLGKRTRRAINRSMESDTMQADELRKAQAKIAKDV